MTDLISAIKDALDGSVTHDGDTVPVYVRGHVGDEVPCVVIERPRLDGNEYMDGSSSNDVRLRVRVHDRKGTGGWYALRSAEIAESVHSALSSGVTVNGSDVPFLEPQRRPVTSEAEGQSTSDLNLIYDTLLP